MIPLKDNRVPLWDNLDVNKTLPQKLVEDRTMSGVDFNVNVALTPCTYMEAEFPKEGIQFGENDFIKIVFGKKIYQGKIKYNEELDAYITGSELLASLYMCDEPPVFPEQIYEPNSNFSIILVDEDDLLLCELIINDIDYDIANHVFEHDVVELYINNILIKSLSFSNDEYLIGKYFPEFYVHRTFYGDRTYVIEVNGYKHEVKIDADFNIEQKDDGISFSTVEDGYTHYGLVSLDRYLSNKIVHNIRVYELYEPESSELNGYGYVDETNIRLHKFLYNDEFSFFKDVELDYPYGDYLKVKINGNLYYATHYDLFNPVVDMNETSVLEYGDIPVKVLTLEDGSLRIFIKSNSDDIYKENYKYKKKLSVEIIDQNNSVWYSAENEPFESFLSCCGLISNDSGIIKYFSSLNSLKYSLFATIGDIPTSCRVGYSDDNSIYLYIDWGEHSYGLSFRWQNEWSAWYFSFSTSGDTELFGKYIDITEVYTNRNLIGIEYLEDNVFDYNNYDVVIHYNGHSQSCYDELAYSKVKNKLDLGVPMRGLCNYRNNGVDEKHFIVGAYLVTKNNEKIIRLITDTNYPVSTYLHKDGTVTSEI